MRTNPNDLALSVILLVLDFADDDATALALIRRIVTSLPGHDDSRGER